MSYLELTDHFSVPSDIGKTWAFFSTAENLPKITPAWMKFTITTRGPIVIENDTLLDYTIRWAGIPIKWRTRIIAWEPRRMFIDLQVRGPYALWHHQHSFEPKPDGGGVICRDRVIYKLPGGPIGSLAHALIVKRQLRDIFRFRRDVIGKHLGSITPLQADVMITRL
jgi:ligand-binding SRPBCC domain-containing protein